MAEQKGSPIPQSPVVIQRVDGGSQWLQDTVKHAAHQGPDIGPQAQVWVPNQAPRHLQESVQLLQVVAYRFYLLAGVGGLGRQGETGAGDSDRICYEPETEGSPLLENESLTPLTT